MNPILKAHLEGVAEFVRHLAIASRFNPNEPIYGEENRRGLEQLKSFLTTYAINLLKAAKEAGPGEEEDNYFETPARTPKEWSERGRKHGHNSCRSSFHSAIDEGIKEISN